MYSSHRSGPEHQVQEYANHGNVSPTQTPTHAYSPTERANRSRIPSVSRQSPQYNRSHPASPTVSRIPLGPPTQERPSSGYYDPTSDSRERAPEYNHSQYHSRSPLQASHDATMRPCASLLWPLQPANFVQSRSTSIHGDRYADFNGNHPDHIVARSRQQSLSTARESVPHAHPTNSINGRDHSPQATRAPHVSDQRYLWVSLQTNIAQPPQARASNPMSVMNILSDTAPVPTNPNPPAITSPRIVRKASKSIDGPQPKIKAEMAYTAPLQDLSGAHDYSSISAAPRPERNGDHPLLPQATPPKQPLPPLTGPPGLTAQATEEAYAIIEARDLSDVEMSNFDGARNEYRLRSNKRAIEVDVKEGAKRKVCVIVRTRKYTY